LQKEIKQFLSFFYKFKHTKDINQKSEKNLDDAISSQKRTTHKFLKESKKNKLTRREEKILW
jgi:hypothetical protein